MGFFCKLFPSYILQSISTSHSVIIIPFPELFVKILQRITYNFQKSPSHAIHSAKLHFLRRLFWAGVQKKKKEKKAELADKWHSLMLFKIIYHHYDVTNVKRRLVRCDSLDIYIYHLKYWELKIGLWLFLHYSIKISVWMVCKQIESGLKKLKTLQSGYLAKL